MDRGGFPCCMQNDRDFRSRGVGRPPRNSVQAKGGARGPTDQNWPTNQRRSREGKREAEGGRTLAEEEKDSTGEHLHSYVLYFRIHVMHLLWIPVGSGQYCSPSTSQGRHTTLNQSIEIGLS